MSAYLEEVNRPNPDSEKILRLKEMINPDLKKMNTFFRVQFNELEELFMKKLKNQDLESQQQRLAEKAHPEMARLHLDYHTSERAGGAPYQPSFRKNAFDVQDDREHPQTIQLGTDEMNMIYNEYSAFLNQRASDFLSSHVIKDYRSFIGIDYIDFTLAKIRRKEESKPRVEIRTVNRNAVQMALCFPNTDMRNAFFKERVPLIQIGGQYQLVKAGSTTIELSVKGVDKGLPIRYVQARYASLLEKMGYTFNASDLINQSEHPTCIISDADGTLWKAPKKGEVALKTGLIDPVKTPLLEYLRKGGILIVNSGNDISRVAQKINEGLKDNLPLLSRIAIFGSGGSTLQVFESNGELKEVPEYRHEVLGKDLDRPSEGHALSFIYVGDDPKRDGNDAPPFIQAGAERSLCVSHEDAPPFLTGAHHQSGLEQGTANFLNALNAYMDRLPHPIEGDVFQSFFAQQASVDGR